MRRLMFLAAFLAGISAVSAVEGAVELNDYTMDFVTAAIEDGANSINNATEANNAGIYPLLHVDEWNFNDFSYVAFVDKDGSGGISGGDLFWDFAVINITSFDTTNSTAVRPNTYGNVAFPAGQGQSASTHELTVLLQANGVQISDDFYLIQQLTQLDAVFDSDLLVNGVPGGAFTPSDINNAFTYADGIVVETASNFLAGSGNNTVPTQPAGELALRFTMQDLLQTGEFETDFRDGLGNLIAGLAVDSSDLVVGVTDSTNDLELGRSQTIATQLGLLYGFTPGIQAVDQDGVPIPGVFVGGSLSDGTQLSFGYTFNSEGSLNKQLVPEPSTVLIWAGMGLIGLVFLRRRRK